MDGDIVVEPSKDVRWGSSFGYMKNESKHVVSYIYDVLKMPYANDNENNCDKSSSRIWILRGIACGEPSRP